MARPLKKGLTYFPHDVDMSASDNMEALEEMYGNNGYAVYNKLLEKIYSDGGKFFISDQETEIRLAKRFHLNSREILIKIINSSAILGLFDKKLWESAKMLSSPRICRTVKTIMKSRVRAKTSYLKKVSTIETP